MNGDGMDREQRTCVREVNQMYTVHEMRLTSVEKDMEHLRCDVSEVQQTVGKQTDILQSIHEEMVSAKSSIATILKVMSVVAVIFGVLYSVEWIRIPKPEVHASETK